MNIYGKDTMPIIHRSIIELIDLIFRKYEMFFGSEKNINNVYYYIYGYMASKFDSKTAANIDKIFHYNFNEWLCNKYSDKIDHVMPWNKIYNKLFISENEKLDTFLLDFKIFINENS